MVLRSEERSVGKGGRCGVATASGKVRDANSVGGDSFFFFQAEDGIRDGHVTGVQTCALPILFPTPTNGNVQNNFVGAGTDKVVLYISIGGCWEQRQNA